LSVKKSNHFISVEEYLLSIKKSRNFDENELFCIFFFIFFFIYLKQKKTMITNTIIINLEKQLKKKEFSLKQANNYNFPSPKVLVATTPNSPRVQLKKGVSLGERACAVSHIRVWEEFYDEKSNDWILVLEDDAFGMVQKQELHDILEETLRIVPSHINMINLGGHKNFKPSNLLANGKNFKLYQYHATDFHAYLIRKSACKTWYQEAWNFQNPIDLVHTLNTLKNSYCVLCYNSDYVPLLERPNGSDHIHQSVGLFAQIRGGESFQSDLEQFRRDRPKNKKSQLNNNKIKYSTFKQKLTHVTRFHEAISRNRGNYKQFPEFSQQFPQSQKLQKLQSLRKLLQVRKSRK
jgi:GR25 family glycosyltransferase involved in LPS biosynthesis